MVYILPHEAKWDVRYDTQIQNELGFKVRENLLYNEVNIWQI